MANNKKTTGLLIIDMQNGFDTSKDINTRKNCIAQVKRAMKKGLPIFLVEFSPNFYGKTSKYITRVIGNYENVHYIEKHSNDGGTQIMNYLDTNNIDIKHFIACGVNISFCVAETVSRLIRKYKKKVLIIKNACNCEYHRQEAFEGCYGNIDTEEVYTDKLVTLV
jgi:nicotinamidase-related amidase